jgi:hypothetical protein
MEFSGMKTDPMVLVFGLGSSVLLMSTPLWMVPPGGGGIAGYAWLGMPTLGLVCVLWLAFVAIRRKTRSFALHQLGFVYGEMGAARWATFAQVIGYSFNVTHVRHGILEYNQGAVKIELLGGNTIKISPEFEKIEELGANLSNQVAQYVIGNVVGMLQQGHEVSVGPFAFTPQGIKRKTLEIPYQEIQDVRESSDWNNSSHWQNLVISGKGKNREIKVRAAAVKNRPFIESIVCAMKPPVKKRKSIVKPGEMLALLEPIEHQIGVAIRKHMTQEWQAAELCAEIPGPGAFNLSKLWLRDPMTGILATASDELIAAATNYLVLHSQHQTGVDRIIVKMRPSKRGGWNLDMTEAIQAND